MSPTLTMGSRVNGARKPAPKSKAKTLQLRKWRGLNLTDARTGIDDDELAWNENAITIGNGYIQILPAVGTAIATVAAGIASMFGITLNGNAYTLTVNSDGSMTQVSIPGGVSTVVCVAGTVTTSAHVTMYQSVRALIVDPTKGYFSWDGTTFAVIDATKTGQSIAVFEGRVFIGNNRTLTYTAPNTYNDFTAGNGAGTTTITDESFPGNIIALQSALEQMWIMGQGAIDALSNVTASGTAPNVVTTFSITNIIAGIGSNAPTSVIGYLRSLAFAAPFAFYALAGVTPQKLSDKLDGLFVNLTFSDAPASVAIVQNLPCLLFLATYTGSNLQSQVSVSGNTPVILGFTQGKWFLAVQNTALKWITTVLVGGVSQCWGTDGANGNIFQAFGASASTPVTYKIQTKLYDDGDATWMKAITKLGFEFQSANSVSPTVTIDSEFTNQNVALTAVNTLQLQNAVLANLQLQNAALANLTIVSQGTVMSRQGAAMFGRYFGATIAGTDAPYRIQAIQFEVTRTTQWSAPPP